MLMSLSKLASKSLSLSSEQASLLCGLLTHYKTPHMQLIVLRSLRHLFEKTSHITPGAVLFENLLRILDDKQFPSSLRCEALQLIVMIVLHVPHNMLFLKLQEFHELLTLVANLAKCPDTSNPQRVLTTQALAEISNKLKGEKAIVASEVNFLALLSEVVSSIGDEVVLQMKQMSGYCKASDIEFQIKSLLQLLFVLIDSPPKVSMLVLDKLRIIFEALVNICCEDMNAMEIASEVHKVVRVEENDWFLLASKIIHYAYRHLYRFTERLCAAKPATDELLYKLKHLVSFVCQCNFVNCSTHVKFALLLHSCGNSGYLLSENEKGKGRHLHGISHLNLLEDGILNDECIGNMLAGNDDWESYLIGKIAAHQGAWFVSDSIFRHLKTRVQSDAFSGWLSSLSQFAHSEKSLQEMFSQESGSVVLDKMAVPSGLDEFQLYILTSDSIDMLTSASVGLFSSEKLLGQTTLLKQTFCFQRWFLSLRRKVLEVIIDLLKLLGTVLYNQEAVNGTNCSHLTQEGDSIMHLLAGLSMKSQKIAREYDLMNSSFINMDPKSYRVVSSIALSCSLMAFCIGLAYLIPNSPIPDKSCTSRHSGDCCLHVTVAEDLVGRLSYIDPETSINIISILQGDAAHAASLSPHSKSHSINLIYESGEILTVCRAAIGRIRSMQSETVGTLDECSLPLEFNKRICFLLDITKEWMSTPFCTPSFFFQVRPCIGAVLYSCSVDDESSTDISVMSGSHLSLNLCLQLKNMPTNFTSRITKVFCILQWKKSFMRPHSKPNETEFVDYKSWSTDSMLRLQEKLRRQVIEQDGEKLNENETFVHFDMNGGFQGFTTCVIDVSAFPAGLYRIDWHSCCIDESGSYWSLLPWSIGPLFTVRSS